MEIWHVNVLVLFICIITVIYFLKEHFRIKNGGKMWMQANVWLRKNAPDYVIACIEQFRRKSDKAILICEKFDNAAGLGGPKFHVGKVINIFSTGASDDAALIDFFNGEYQVEIEIKTLKILCPGRQFAIGDKVKIYMEIG